MLLTNAGLGRSGGNALMGRGLLLIVLLAVLQLTLAACTQTAATISVSTQTPSPTTANGDGFAIGPKSEPGPNQPVRSFLELVEPAGSEPNTADLRKTPGWEVLQRVAQAAPKEVVPGFGGLFIDPRDIRIVYVYMLDPSQQEAAELAVRCILRRGRPAEVRVLQGKYSLGQLRGWFQQAQRALWPIDYVFSSEIDQKRNRIAFRVGTSYAAQQAREALAKTSVPGEAVVFDVAVQNRLDDPPVQIESLIGVNISLEIERTVPAGRPVSIEVVLANGSDDAVEFDHGIPFHENVMIFAPNGDQVWAKRLRGEGVVGTGGSTRLRSGDQVSLQTLWDQRDQDGFELPPGRYLVRGTVQIGDNVDGFYRAMDLATEPYELVIQP